MSGGGNLISGIQQGGAVGGANAAVGAAKIGAGSGVLSPGTSSTVNTAAGYGGNLLGLYSGIQQGGVAGDTGAAVNAAELATKGAAYGASTGLFGDASGAVGDAASAAGEAIPVAGAALSVYNAVENYKSGATGSDALSGAEAGAAIGSIIPGIGTLIGGVVGGVVGAVASAFGPGETDPETSDVKNVINATGANGNNPAIAASVQNPYLQLAGLFDEHSSTLPMYQQYGRMGEQQFTNDMVDKINDAYKAGTISANSTPTQVYNSVVAPWVAGMGQGWSDVGSTYTATTQGLLQDMVSQYMNGTAATNWQAVGGQNVFNGITAYGGNGTLTAVQAPSSNNTGPGGSSPKGPVEKF